MNEYLESIRILLEIDEPNMELVYLIKSFPIKLIDGANSLFSNPEFELATKEENINFVGNVEPRDIPAGNTNILVSDGFVGNTALKMFEGSASNLLGIVKDEVLKSSLISKIGVLLLKPVLKTINKKFDYKEYGGAPFLGVKGICIKAHGTSDGKAIKNAIRQSKMFYESKILDEMRNEFTCEI